MSSHGDRPASPSFTKLITSIGSMSGLPCLPNHSSSGTTSQYNSLEVQNSTLILCNKREKSHAYGKSYGHKTTINILPDYVLLEIFDSCRKDHDSGEPPFIPAWRWHGLVHVCRRWRQVVFESPRRLDLQIFCTNGTPVRENLDIWPPFPISIQYPNTNAFTPHDKDNIFAALEHPGRICYVELYLAGSHLSEVATVIQEPLPALEHLTLDFDILLEDERPPALPIGFLGGSAPRLRYMRLGGIPFPTLPTLLSSTSDLVDLRLDNIPEDDHISPEAMVVCLASLTKLKFLQIGFLSELTASYDRIHLPPVTRTVLPALTSFQFEADSAYLEEFVTQIDSPQLNRIIIKYLNAALDLRVAQLFMFIDRSDALEKAKYAAVTFSVSSITFETYLFPESYPDWCHISPSIHRLVIARHIPDIDEVFGQSSKMLSHVIHLKLSANYFSGESLLLLRKFTTVRTLHVSKEFASEVALELEDIAGEMVAQVLPVLDFIYLDGQPVSCVEKFLSARRLSGHPVTLVDTEVEFEERVKSY